MKKNVLAICFLLLGGCLLSLKSSAQEAPGSYGGEIGYKIPTYIKSVKRNNGNGTTELGAGEVRLSFSKNSPVEDIQLIGIAYIDDATNNVSNLIMMGGFSTIEKGYYSYSIAANTIPAKKLVYYFVNHSNSSSFNIAEN